jgi:hypothetical protein
MESLLVSVAPIVVRVSAPPRGGLLLGMPAAALEYVRRIDCVGCHRWIESFAIGEAFRWRSVVRLGLFGNSPSTILAFGRNSVSKEEFCGILESAKGCVEPSTPYSE